MSKETVKQDKIICPECRGNGYVRIPYHLAKEEIWANCEECDSQGEIKASDWKDDPVPNLREKGLV